MSTVLNSLPCCLLRRLVAPSIVVGLLSTLGVLSGVVPSLPGSLTGLSFSQAAYAQNGSQFSDQELENYVRAAETLELRRRNVVEEIKGITGYVPAIACDRPSTLNELPDQARQIAIDYCNWAISVVENNNLTIGRFNTIMTAHQSDEEVSRRIRCIQQPGAACP